MISQFILKHKKTVVLSFLLLAVIGIVLSFTTTVNYKMVDYLPKDAPSTVTLSIMEEEFDNNTPNARVMLKNVTILEALTYKDEISEAHGVISVTWLDDVVGKDVLLSTPTQFLDASILKNYYKEGNALLSITIESGEEAQAVNEILALIGEENALAGEAVNNAEMQGMAVSEVLNAMLILIPIILLILVISTSSWIEPILFLATIGTAVAINMGTTAFFTEISFVTQTVSPILQLAVSLDYAIFLLHSYDEYRATYHPAEAMKLAMRRAFSTVAASAATTVIGFLALLFMRFGIGSDLGIHLAKGVVLSFLSVMVFLPAFTLLCHNILEKFRHKSFIPSFGVVGKVLMKTRIPFMILALLIVVPSFLAQRNTGFMYGMGALVGESRTMTDAAKIDEQFGKENPLVLIVPRGDIGKEKALCDDLSMDPHITSIVSYSRAVGAEIPAEYVPAEVLNQFYSANYSRIILYTDNPDEGDESFNTVENVMNTAANYYGDYHLAGQSATLYDMKDTVEIDTGVVNLIAIVGIFVVILITFRSLLVPVFLVFSIETAIWINLSFAYFTDSSLSFIGYLIISTVQLGATVDYAILLTSRYLADRGNLPKKEAMQRTLSENLPAILVSAGILSAAGFTLAATSSNPIIAELGTLLGRGTVLSFIMVVCVLPALLLIFDKAIEKTTLKKRNQPVSTTVEKE